MLTRLCFACSGLFVSQCLVSFTSRLIAFHALFARLRFIFALAFCLSPAFVIHYAFIFMLFYHVTVSFVVGCLSSVSCFFFFFLGGAFALRLYSLVFSLFEAFFIALLYYRRRRFIDAWN